MNQSFYPIIKFTLYKISKKVFFIHFCTKKNRWCHPGSNWRPSLCESDVITSTLWHHNSKRRLKANMIFYTKILYYNLRRAIYGFDLNGVYGRH